MKIILADDSDLILDRLRDLLETHKKVEIIASLRNGTETLEAINVLKPDLAIIDIEMPGLTGLEVIREVRKTDNSVKFIILSFYDSNYYRELSIRSGADYFFSKADDFDKVLQVVEGMLHGTENFTKFKLQI